MNAILNEPRRSARKAKGDGHLRRAEILLAAERIFVAHGYEAATIRKIADEVGVSSTALYMHFRDKDQILLEICTGAMEELLAGNRQISAMPIDAVARVRLMLEAYVRFAMRHPNAYQLIFCGSAEVDSIRRQHASMQLGSECSGAVCVGGSRDRRPGKVARRRPAHGPSGKAGPLVTAW